MTLANAARDGHKPKGNRFIANGMGQFGPSNRDRCNVDRLEEVLRAIAADTRGLVAQAQSLQAKATALSKSVLDAAVVEQIRSGHHG